MNWKAREFTGSRGDLEQGYTVQKGDTLWAISKRTGIPVEELMKMNGIDDPRKLREGQKLFVSRSQSVRDMGEQQRPMTRPSILDELGVGKTTGYSQDRLPPPREEALDPAMMPYEMAMPASRAAQAGLTRFMNTPRYPGDYGQRIANARRFQTEDFPLTPAMEQNLATTISRNPARSWGGEGNMTLDQLYRLYGR